MLRIAGKEIPDADAEMGVSVPEFQLVEFSGKDIKDIDLDLIVADTSTLPVTQQAQNDQVMMWLANGIVTPEEVLKYRMLKVPHAEQILADRAQQAQVAPPPEMGGMEAPEEPDMAMEAAMSPMPQGADEAEMMQAAEMAAAEFGIPPEQIMAEVFGLA